LVDSIRQGKRSQSSIAEQQAYSSSEDGSNIKEALEGEETSNHSLENVQVKASSQPRIPQVKKVRIHQRSSTIKQVNQVSTFSK